MKPSSRRRRPRAHAIKSVSWAILCIIIINGLLLIYPSDVLGMGLVKINGDPQATVQAVNTTKSTSIAVREGWTRIEAESCDSLGPSSIQNNNGVLTYIAGNPWAQYNSVNLHTGTNYLQVRVANGGDTARIQLLVGGIVVDTIIVGNTGDWNTFKILPFKLSSLQSGVKDIKFVFLNGQTNLDWFMFSGTKQRVVISSDFPPLDVCMSGCAADHTSDPDDVQSMVRFLLCSNEFDVEGLVASSGTYANIARKQNILDMLNLYDQADENLRKHDIRYPTADYLRSVTFQGRSGTWGGTVSNNIGSGKDSQASDSIINIIDRPDPRPVWFCFWGDCSNLAQAIWKVQHTRSASDLQTFLSKIRIYQVAHQDSTIDWMLNNFPDLFIIYSKSTFMGIFGGSGDPLGNLTWLNANVRQNHGPLGAVYPSAAMGVDGLKEGDSPSFMYLVSAAHGMNDPEDPTQPNWGGQYVRSGITNHWVDGTEATTISKWKSQYQAEFAQRADWMLDSIKVSAPNNVSSMFVGDKLKMNAQIIPGNATATNVSWSVLQPGLANIDTSGNLTATAAGNVTVKANAKDASGISGSYHIVISNRLADSVQVTSAGNKNVMYVGETLQMNASVMPLNTTNPACIWSIAPTGLAQISTGGLVTAIIKGKVVVKAATTDGSGVSDTMSISILNRLVQSITISAAGNEDSLQIGKTLQMSAQVLPQDATNTAFTWSTSPDSIATIDANGLLTAIAPGQVTIKASAKDESGTVGTLNKIITGLRSAVEQGYNDQKAGIYPNPVFNELKIHYESGFNSIAIFDMEGKLMVEKKYNEDVKSDALQLNLAKGVYILKLRNAQAVYQSKIIVE